jgi:acyl-CoA synthetase (AMP-forming)/AMP-acid ligase II
VGTVYFASPERFEYFGDRHATRERHSPGGWATLDDVGWIDEDGYLYLTDRRTHMIVSGGVNVYPREAEDVLLQHAAVLDAAVIGVPDEDLGEVPLAVVQLVPGTVAAPELAHELIELCRARLAHYKCPRTIEFTDALPRQENGKLYKQALREPYWRGHHTRVV